MQTLSNKLSFIIVFVWVCLGFAFSQNASRQSTFQTQNNSTPSISPTPSQNYTSAEWFCDERWDAAYYIFVGTVEDINPPENLTAETKDEFKRRMAKFALKNIINLQIDKVYKGTEKARQIEVLNLQTADLSAINFKPGEKYLFYLEGATINKNEILFYSVLPNSKTKLFSESAETINFLEKNFNRNIFDEVLGTPAKDVVLGGIVSGKATNLVRPPYPQEAKKDKISGSVRVYVLVDETGQVIKAKAVCPIHPALGKASEQAALASRFAPIKVKGKEIKVCGVLVYNFVF